MASGQGLGAPIRSAAGVWTGQATQRLGQSGKIAGLFPSKSSPISISRSTAGFQKAGDHSAEAVHAGGKQLLWREEEGGQA